MKLCVLGPSLKAMGYSTKKLIDEARKAGFKVDHVPVIDVKLIVDNKLDAVHNKTSLSKYDYILPRIDSKRAGIGYPVMRFLDLLGVRKPYPAETIIIAHNKFISLERLAYSGIAVPETYLTGSKDVASDIVKNGKLPMMLKLLSGFGGRGVMRASASDQQDLQRLPRVLPRSRWVSRRGPAVSQS